MGTSCYLKIQPIEFTQINKKFLQNNEIFIFTRYLYEKDEVKIALLMALLNKTEDAPFWAYELYYSGFVDELFELLWKIYYDFYATLNPQFEDYLTKIFSNDFTKQNNEKLIYMIIHDFIMKPYNIDVFVLERLSRTNIEKDYLEKLSGAKAFKNTFDTWLDSYDYINIALYIFEDCQEDDLDTIIEYYVDYFGNYIRYLDKNKQLKQIKKLQKKSGQSKRKIILSKILSFYSMLSNLNMGKHVYICCENEDIDSYRTIEEEPSYTILSKACRFNIDSKHYLSLFHLKRDKSEIRQSYLNNWLYFAAFSPIWYSRIQKYRGVINHERKIITFADDDDLEIFSNKYNYEPDEQKKEIQDRSIQNIENIRTWRSFYEEHQKNCLIDIDPNYFDDLIKIEY